MVDNSFTPVGPGCKQHWWTKNDCTYCRENMKRFDTSISSVGEDLSQAGFRVGDNVSVVKTEEVKRLEQEIDRLTKQVQDLKTYIVKVEQRTQDLDKASTAFVVKKQDDTYVRRGKNALYITYSRSMAKHRASAFLGSTVHEVKLVISPEHVASTCTGCGRINHG